MPPLLYELAGGTFQVPATLALAFTLLVAGIGRHRRIAILNRLAALVAIGVIVASSPALPWGFVGAWFSLTLAWLCLAPSRRRAARAVAAAAFLATVVGVVLSSSAQRWDPLPAGDGRTLYVIGDSVTAGLGRRGETTWPALLRAAHAVRIVDRSRAGSTIRQSIRTATPVGGSPAVVLIEIGGNDLIGHADRRQFEADLDDLVKAAVGPGRQVVLFELPRFPFDDAYGRAQRRIARRYGIHLVPRRLLADVLASPGATTDGVHLSNAGQARLADLVWHLVGAALGDHGPADR